MVTADVSQWDETICDMTVCQHPQCWATIRRIEQGHPRVRLRNFDSLCRDSEESKDELPTLKIINFPSNCSPRGRLRCSNCNRTFSTFTAFETSSSPSLYETSVHDFSDRNSEVSSERTHFPGLNSVVDSHTIPQREMSFTYLNKVGNLQVMDLSETAAPKQDYCPDSGYLTVKWVPNIHRKSQRPEAEAATELKPLRRVYVKDLASENLFSLKELQSKGRDIDIVSFLEKRKKSKKVPTGGQPYQLSTKRSQKINWATKKIKSVPRHRGDSSAAKEGKPKESQIKKKHSSPRQLQTATIVELQDQGALQLGNQSVDLPDATKKHMRPLLVQKFPVMNLKEQDLERIGNRPYLRKPFEGSLGMRGHDTKRQQLPGCAETGPVVLAAQSLESCTLDGTEEASANRKQPSQKASAEQESQEGKGLRKQHVGLGKRRSSVMYVLYKSSTASLVLEVRTRLVDQSIKHTEFLRNQLFANSLQRMQQNLYLRDHSGSKKGDTEGVGENGHLLPKPETQYEMYCKHLASRKEAAQALGYLQGGSSQQQPDQAALTPDLDKHEDDSYPNPPPPPPSPFPLRENDKPSPDVESPLFREDSALRASSEQGDCLD